MSRTSDNHEILAQVKCGQHSHVLRCTESGFLNTVFFMFDTPTVAADCIAVCPRGTMNFTIEGSLVFINERTISSDTSTTQVEGQMQNDLSFVNDIFHNCATPCNRDIVLMLSGLSTVGSQDNFQKQLDFVANVLTPTWQVGLDWIRVVINLVVDADYALIWSADELADNQVLSGTVLGLTEDVPDVTQNNNTNLQCIFKYAQGAVSFDAKEEKERAGVQKAVIAFVPQNPNDDQDFYEAMEFAHTTRTTDDTKIIIVAMGKNLDVSRLSLLSYGSGFTFQADYDGLSSLAPMINQALCEPQPSSCGA
ncbi:unnamed protein product [Haemonchus placei]|uniref:VWFA domain-containing protein n=1 Tax=Haemonchus placei TaxID=6290 RepID=A0A0N4W4Q1_HAEPC|nr:unnamed protein product [Haemonchus placei]